MHKPASLCAVAFALVTSVASSQSSLTLSGPSVAGSINRVSVRSGANVTLSVRPSPGDVGASLSLVMSATAPGGASLVMPSRVLVSVPSCSPSGESWDVQWPALIGVDVHLQAAFVSAAGVTWTPTLTVVTL